MATKKILHDTLRARYMEIVRAALAANGEEVLTTGTNEFALPCVDAEGNDEYLVLTFKVPTGSRDGEPYDGHAAARDFALHCEEKAAKAAKAAEAKARKMERDAKARAAKAAAKAEREAK